MSEAMTYATAPARAATKNQGHLSLVSLKSEDDERLFRWVHWDDFRALQGRIVDIDGDLITYVHARKENKVFFQESQLSVLVPCTGERMRRARGIHRERMVPQMLTFRSFLDAMLDAEARGVCKACGLGNGEVCAVCQLPWHGRCQARHMVSLSGTLLIESTN